MKSLHLFVRDCVSVFALLWVTSWRWQRRNFEDCLDFLGLFYGLGEFIPHCLVELLKALAIGSILDVFAMAEAFLVEELDG